MYKADYMHTSNPAYKQHPTLAETVSFQPQGKKLQFPGVESYQPSTFF
jgi:hypothetical protein